MSHFYTIAVTALGGRSGFASSSDGRLRVELSIPRALGGDDGPGTNPEQLFAAARAASLLAAIRQVAHARNLQVSADSNVTATITVDGEASEYKTLSVALAADIPSLDITQATEIVREAMLICPIARATCQTVSTHLRVD